MDDKNKKELGYSADIQYQEDYYSEHANREQTVDIGSDSLEDYMDDDFMDIIKDDIKDLIHLVPGLPVQLQTAINQVLKPVIRDWKKIKDNQYPKTIPNGDIHITFPDPEIINPIPPTWEGIKPIIPDPSPSVNPPEYNPYPEIVIPNIVDPTPSARVEPNIDYSDSEDSLIDDDGLFTSAAKAKIVKGE